MGIEFKDQTVQLSEGEMIVVPRGEEHKPFAKDECKVLLVEPNARCYWLNQKEWSILGKL